MREGICEQFELHGYGKLNIWAVERISNMISAWIRILEIDTERISSRDGFMVVVFKPKQGYSTSFREYKAKARAINKDKKKRQDLEETNAKTLNE